MACGVTAFGQFIPQPNAYNPDANGDSFIGVDDVMGTLALFGKAFDNGDSLQIMDLEMPETGLYEIDPGTDIVMAHALNDCSLATLILPDETGWKTIAVMMTTEDPGGTVFRPASPNPSDPLDPHLLITFNLNTETARLTYLTHAPNGRWYRLN